MRILTLLLLLAMTGSVQAQGFLDSIRRRVNDTVNNAVDEVRSVTNQEINDVNQDVSQSTDGIVDDVLPQVPIPGVAIPPASSAASSAQPGGQVQGGFGSNPFWGTPSGNNLLALDQEIQGLRLGMPTLLVDGVLQERGYERSSPGQYMKRQLTDDGRIMRTQRIRYLAVQPSQEFIGELPGGTLKDMVLAAQQTLSAGQQAAGSGGLRQRGADARQARRSSSSTQVPGNLELVYLILYEQIYDQNVSQFDLGTMMGQVRGAFGPSTYPDDVYRQGLAFRTSPDTTLIYHDASLLSADYRNALIEAVPERGEGHREAVYYALLAPCGGPENPFGAPGGGGCPPGWYDAHEGDFDSQLELARAVLSPFMRIGQVSSGTGIETRLEWSYLQAESGLRERNAEQMARENAPPAQLDF